MRFTCSEASVSTTLYCFICGLTSLTNVTCLALNGIWVCHPIWFNSHSVPHEEAEKSCELIPFQILFFLNWCLVDLQCCVSFRYTAKRFSYARECTHTHTHTHTHRVILFQIIFYYRLLQDFEYSSLCYTVGPSDFFRRRFFWSRLNLNHQLKKLTWPKLVSNLLLNCQENHMTMASYCNHSKP